MIAPSWFLQCVERAHLYIALQDQFYYIFLEYVLFMIEEITIDKQRDVHFIKIDMYSAPIVMIKGRKGYVMCGYLNMQTAEKLGDAAALVRGVKDRQSIMKATIEETTTAGQSLGLQKGKKVEEVIGLL
jgi:uncharacterized protein YunC (DUF1805 family)